MGPMRAECPMLFIWHAACGPGLHLTKPSVDKEAISLTGKNAESALRSAHSLGSRPIYIVPKDWFRKFGCISNHFRIRISGLLPKIDSHFNRTRSKDEARVLRGDTTSSSCAFGKMAAKGSLGPPTSPISASFTFRLRDPAARSSQEKSRQPEATLAPAEDRAVCKFVFCRFCLVVRFNEIPIARVFEPIGGLRSAGAGSAWFLSEEEASCRGIRKGWDHFTCSLLL